MIIDRVSSVNIYPLKSAHAATVNGEIPMALPVGPTGFEVNGVRDRDFVLYSPEDNTFVTQRGWDARQTTSVHKGDKALAAVRMDIQDDHIAVSSRVGELELTNAAEADNRMTIDIFGKQFPAIEQDADASHYFSMLLGREVRLLRADRERARLVSEGYRREDAFNQMAAADGYPFLLTSEASLAAGQERNDIVPGSVPLGNFRANVSIDGQALGAFGEDYIGRQKFHIGAIGMYVAKACIRCPIPNIDQETGEIAAVGGLKALRGRRGHQPGSETDKGVFFGQSLLHVNKGVISVGDAVMVEALEAEPNIVFTS
jgi:uncharacterized protein YcbX